MIKIGQTKGINVFLSENIFFIESKKDKIILGYYFKNLTKESQNTLLNRALFSIEYVNANNITSSIKVEKEIDLFVNSKGYSLDVVGIALKDMFNSLAKLEKSDQISNKMKEISDRYINLQTYSNKTGRKITA